MSRQEHTPINTIFDGEDIYAPPIPNKKYKLDRLYYLNKITILMKWVLLTRKHPELHENIEQLLKTNCDIVNVKSCSHIGHTALYIACRYSNIYSTVETVELLLKYGADPNLSSHVYDEEYPLAVAVKYSRTDSSERTVALLLKYGADVNSDSPTSLIHAIKCVNVTSTFNTIKILLENGADPNAYFNRDGTNSYIISPLACALHLINNVDSDIVEQIVKLLLKYHADVNFGISGDNDSYTYETIPIVLAFEDIRIMRLLLEQGADPNLYNYNELYLEYVKEPCSALFWACYKPTVGYVDQIIEVLLEYGANPYVVYPKLWFNTEKTNPLMLLNKYYEKHITFDTIKPNNSAYNYKYENLLYTHDKCVAKKFNIERAIVLLKNPGIVYNTKKYQSQLFTEKLDFIKNKVQQSHIILTNICLFGIAM